MKKKIDGSIIFRTVVACAELFRTPMIKYTTRNTIIIVYGVGINLSFRRDFSLRQIRKFQLCNNNENQQQHANGNNKNNNNIRTLLIPVPYRGNFSTNSTVGIRGMTLIRKAPIIFSTFAPKIHNYMLLNMIRIKLYRILLYYNKYSLY